LNLVELQSALGPLRRNGRLLIGLLVLASMPVAAIADAPIACSGSSIDSHYLWWASQGNGPNSLYRVDANGTSYTASPIPGPDTTKYSTGTTGILAYTSSPSMTDATIIPQDKWRVERCQGVSCTNFAQIATVTSAAFNDTGLATPTNYSYRVRATDAAGNLGPYSNVAGATTLAF